MDEVEWRPYPPDPRYMVGSDGTILSQFGRPMKPGIGYTRAYPRTTINLGGQQTSVPQAVALAFLGPRPEGHEVDHMDNNPGNNRADNLQYVTHAENMRLIGARMTHCRKGHSLEDAYLKLGGPKRICRRCNLDKLARKRRANGVPERGPRIYKEMAA